MKETPLVTKNMLAWMNHDGKLVLTARIIRSLTTGFFGVALSVYLSLLGYSAVLIGIALTASLVSSSAYTIAASFLERKYGRRKVLLLFVLLSTAAGGLFVLSTNYAVILIAMCIGTISYTGGAGGGGPFSAIEQAIIPQTVPAERRTRGYAMFNTGARLASSAGALLLGVPEILERSGLGIVDSFRVIFLITVIGTFSSFFIFIALSSQAEAKKPSQNTAEKPAPVLSPESKRKIAKLASLMGLDSFGSGFIIQSIVSLWFFSKFGISLGDLSLIFFASGLAATSTFLISARISEKIGLVNTMVFTHLPSNVLTMLIPFAPTVSIAVALYVSRSLLGQMDIAPRQSYIAAIVKPEERVAAAGFTSVSSSASQAVSPSISGYFMQFASTFSLPFFASGALKAAYDIILFFNFRALKAPEEMKKTKMS